MRAIEMLVGIVFVLSAGFAIYRFLTLPVRAGRSIQRLSNIITQRQADKAAGKPVAPINYVGLAGLGLFIVGVVVARAESAIFGLLIMAIGLGVIVMGFNMAKTAEDNAHQSDHNPTPTPTSVDPSSPVFRQAPNPLKPPAPQSPGTSSSTPPVQPPHQ